MHAPSIRTPMRGSSLAGCDLSGQDLSRVDLTGADLTGANLRGTCLFQATLDGAEFAGADLTEADLREATGEQVGFGGARLRGADLTAATLPRASFTRGDLTGACLRGATLGSTRFVDATLVDTDFTGAVLREATLSRCAIGGASFRDAGMRDVKLAHLQGYDRANWVGADLREADTCGAYDLRRFAHDQNYLDEFYARSPRHRVLYALWWATSDCGRSLTRWSAWTASLAVTFAAIYASLPIAYGAHETALSPLYFSVVTLTTLGFGDALPTTVAGQLTVMVEVLCGYFMLGGLLAILSNKMARRAD